VHLWATLEQERSSWGNSGAARRRARDIYRRINDDEGGSQPLVFTRASQNVTAAAILLWTMPVPSTTEGRQIRNELRELLECVTVQQAESSASRRCEPEAKLPMEPSQQEREASVHPEPRGAPERNKAPSVRDRLGDNMDTRAILDACRRNEEDGVVCGYHPCQGRRYDSEED
jgi:hypothetical protein